MINLHRHPASFKDPSGFVFEAGGVLYRQVNQVYAPAYRHLMESGLYKQLTEHKQLITHEEADENLTGDAEWYKTLLPQKLELISYPYEWCFDQLKDAALLTLHMLRTSLQHGMILKDATPFNIQFRSGRPVFIDTLSFDLYDPSQPWIAYRQFCRCFLFPLYLEHYLKADIQKLMSTYLDGVPVEFIARLLPLKSRLSLGVWLHVYLQNTNYINDKGNKSAARFSRKKLLDLITHLEGIIKKFPSEKQDSSTWSNYYEETILSKDYLQAKETIIRKMLDGSTAKLALDLGANDGHFSKILSEYHIPVVATDADSRCINRLYQQSRKKQFAHILPLVMDITNPSPAVGFHNRERAAFHDRIRPDLVLALALVHHLVIGRNIAIPVLADYFADITPQLIIEFVPKEDEKVKQMLSSRPDVFADYTQEQFESCFEQYFTILKRETVPGTSRILYLMNRKGQSKNRL